MNKILLLIAFTFLTFNISCKKDPASSKNTAPIASFTITPDIGTTNDTFTFDASGSTDNEDETSILQIRWDWENDGTYDTEYSTTKTATHQFNSVGTFTIKLEVKDSEGLTNEITKTVIVSADNTAPTASFIVDPTSGNIFNIFNFNAGDCSDNEDATSELEVRWDWEDDGTWDTNYSTNKTATHQYGTVGTHTIKLEVKDNEELANTTTKEVIISIQNTGTVTDIDGNIYNTIQIGNQWWMAENYKVTHYNNGEAIPNITDKTEWTNQSSGAYCNYNNDEANVSIYGRLYNWYTVNDPRGLAPEGWHIPSDDEWKQLEINLGMSQTELDAEGWRGTDEGGKMKDVGTTLWDSPNDGATNISGFSAFPGGYLHNDHGLSYNLGSIGFWWSSNEGSSTRAWHRRLEYNYSSVFRRADEKQGGFSVRCIKN